VTLDLFRRILKEELVKVSAQRGASNAKYDEAAWLLDKLVSSDDFPDFLTEPAYDMVSAVPTAQEVLA
jgi:hypothetical protein